jgi:hypothetical protein
MTVEELKYEISDSLNFIATLNGIMAERTKFMLEYIKDSGMRAEIALVAKANERFVKYMAGRMNYKDVASYREKIELSNEKIASLSVIYGRIRFLNPDDLAKYEDEVVSQIVIQK